MTAGEASGRFSAFLPVTRPPDASPLPTVRSLDGGTGEFGGNLAFSSDGNTLAASWATHVVLWDVQIGSELFSLYGNPSNVFGVSFSPDGKSLATSGADGSVRTYSLNLEELVELARTRLTRTLTEDECRKFLHTSTCP